MILYFSGTGNSEYAAKRIARAVGDEAVNLFDKIKKGDFSPIYSEKSFIIVTPTYAWRIPHIVSEWLEKTELTGNKNVYFVMTCGGEIGNAGKYLEALCAEKSLLYRGVAGIKMPENYVAMFSVPSRDEAMKTIENAESVIDGVIDIIKSGGNFAQSKISFAGKMYSGIVNSLFYPMFVHSKKFYADDKCISCGKCVKLCPLENIKMENGRPVWGDNCTHCMACICRCPKEAIEYGDISKGKPRYVCPKEI